MTASSRSPRIRKCHEGYSCDKDANWIYKGEHDDSYKKCEA